MAVYLRPGQKDKARFDQVRYVNKEPIKRAVLSRVSFDPHHIDVNFLLIF